MKDRVFRFRLFLAGFIFVIDLITVRALVKLSEVFNTNILPILIIHSAIFIIFLFLVLNFNPFKTERHPRIVANILVYTGAVSLFYFPKIVLIVFSIIEDILILILTVFHKRIFPFYELTFAGFLFASLIFLILLYGMLIGRFRFKERIVSVPVPDVPEEMTRLNIIHISDIHIGSFFRFRKKLRQALSFINSLNPDLVLFSGDMVNNFSEEINGWENDFRNIKSSLGKYAVLGNHDYGDYFSWDSEEEKKENQKILYDFYTKTGFKLLMNEPVTIPIGNYHLEIIGVENWGAPPFKQYGDLQKAINQSNTANYRILLSHDPSHWDAEVLNKTNINLTLSGHTHGMQLGIRIGKYEWSPSSWLYKRWGGLYRENGQYLYVNRGLGFIGLPLRIGILPEITHIKFVRPATNNS